MKIEYENLTESNKGFKQEFLRKLDAFLDNGYFILGNEVINFELAFSKYCKAKYCIGVASGLDALTLGLSVLDLPKGSEVLVPSNTYIATILAILNNGLVPVLVEPNLSTYNIDITELPKKITRKTSALMIVHLYGKSCDMDAIVDFCESHKLKLIEDCAQAHGADYKGRKVGTFGDIGAFSFYPTKNLGALGDAGAILTNNEATMLKLKSLRNYGSSKKYYNDYVGFNSRIDELQASFLSLKLSQLDEMNKRKRNLARFYLNELDPKFTLPVEHDDYYDVYHIFNIRHSRRDQLREYLKENNVTTEVHYPVPPHRQKAMANIITGNYPISDLIHSTTLSLPIAHWHKPEDIQRVISLLNRFDV